MSATAPPNPDDKKNRDPKSLRDWLDTAAKLVAALAGIFAIWVANSFQASLSTTNLVNQREEAESSLRATMFGNLIQKLIKNTGDEPPQVEEELLLAELLALNFHENFEFKPLLIHLKERLSNENIKDRELKEFELLSVVRRVVQRQESLVTRVNHSGSSGRPAEGGACLSKIIVLAQEVDNTRPPNKEKTIPTDAKCSDTIIVREAASDRRTILSPDKRTRLNIEIQSIDWINEEVEIKLSLESAIATATNTNSGTGPVFGNLYNTPYGKDFKGDLRTLIYLNTDQLQYQKNRTAEQETQLKTVQKGGEALQRNFNLTRFDFPMTDYTLLEDGTRFALYIDEMVPKNPEVCGKLPNIRSSRVAKNPERCKKPQSPKDPQFVRIKLLWFPNDFFSPRERPTSYRAYRNKPWEAQ